MFRRCYRPLLQCLIFFFLPFASTYAAMQTAGGVDVTENGAARYTSPIQVPPGVAGIAPKLAFTYSSQQGNGLLGVGWSLSGLSSIVRCPQTRAQDGGSASGINHDMNDRYCLDGQRLMLVAGTYGGDGAEYRTERESFSRIISYGVAGNGPAWFKVWTRAGQVMEFGATEDARIEARGSATVRTWVLNKVQDSTANYLTVRYTEDTANGAFYPLRIDYTGNANSALAPTNSIRFAYEARTDVSALFQAGALIQNTIRLTHVETFTGTTLVRDYRLQYGASTQTGRALLATLTECEGQGGTCLPPTRFDWLQQASQFSATRWETRGGRFIAKEAHNAPWDLKWFAADVNGDGRSDLINIYPLQRAGAGISLRYVDPQWGVSSLLTTAVNVIDLHMNTGGQLQFQSRLESNEGSDDQRWFVADVNGDGKADIIQVYGSAGGAQINAYISTATGFQLQRWETNAGNYDSSQRWFVADVNGDGRPDLINVFNDNGLASIEVHLNTGNGFVRQRWESGAGGIADGQKWMVGDVNGDGKADLVNVFNDNGLASIDVHVSTGSAFQIQRWETQAGGFSDSEKWLVGDVNGDGKADLINVFNDGGMASIDVHRSTGTAFQGSRWETQAGGYADSQRWLVADVNGDGRTDLIAVSNDNNAASIDVHRSTGTAFQSTRWETQAGGFWDAQEWLVADMKGEGVGHPVNVFMDAVGADGKPTASIDAHVNAAPPADRLRAVTSGLGATTTLSYAPLPNAAVYIKDSGADLASFPVIDVQAPLYVVASVSTPNGIDGSLTTNYAYGGLKFDASGRGMLGFRWSQASSVDTGIVNRTVFRQDWPYTGMPQQTLKRLPGAGNGGLLQQVVNDFGCNDFRGGNTCMVMPGRRYFPTVSKRVESNWDLNGAALPVVSSTAQYDAFGNATQSTVTTADGMVKSVNNIYSNDTANWFLGRLTRTTVSGTTAAQAASVSRTTAYAYDAGSGLPSREIVEPDLPPLRLETAYAYDARGNKTGVTLSSPATGAAAIAARSSSTLFDAAGQFPVASINALNQTTVQSVGPRFGEPLVQSDANGLTTAWSVDNFGRKVREVRADGNQTRWDYLYCAGVANGAATCPPRARYLVQATPLAADGVTPNGPWSRTYYDVLEREVDTQIQGFDGVAIIRKSTSYDALGHVWQVSRPYISTQSPQWVSTSYDALERVREIRQPDNSATIFSFNGLSTTATNAAGQTRTQIKDGQGRLATIIDATGSILSYQYDPFDNLVRTTDPMGNTIALSYDIRGNKTRMVDPDMGLWSYSYDALGELVSQTDAKGQVTTLAYDQLGRMTSRSEADLVSRWTYDACTMGIGKLCNATTDNGYSRSVSYDSVGRAAGASTVLDTTYVTGNTYDAQGRIATQLYPTGMVIRYVYTALGYLQEVRDNATNALVWRADAQDAQGHWLQQTFGNNVTTRQTYDAAMGRLQSITAGVGNNSVQDLRYAYDAIGNLASRSDANQNLNEVFTYDSLRRLTRATLSSGASQGFTYDAIGNITQRSDLGSYRYADPYTAATRSDVTALYVVLLGRAPDFDGLVFWATLIDRGALTLAQTADYFLGTDAAQAIYPASMGNQQLISSFYTRVLGRPADSGGLAFWTAQLNAGISRGTILSSILQISRRSSATDVASLKNQALINNKVALAEYFAEALRSTNYTAGVQALATVTDDPATLVAAQAALASTAGSVNLAWDTTLNSRPHAMSELTLNSGGKRAYQFDANGNLVSEVWRDAAGNAILDKGRIEVYTSFNMPQALGAPGMSLAFAYGPEHQRVKQIAMAGTTIYVHPDNEGGLLYEKELKADGTVEHRHFITVGDQLVALVRQTGAATETSYFHQDNLGSTTAITDASGSVVERFSYEAFGKRRFVNGAADPTNTIAGVQTDRGYTTQEHLEELGLIHMNGRIYDPALGRFMSADPTLPHPLDLQSFNRYAYARNNPLAYVDPSGFDDVDVAPLSYPAQTYDFGSGINSLNSFNISGSSGFGGSDLVGLSSCSFNAVGGDFSLSAGSGIGFGSGFGSAFGNQSPAFLPQSYAGSNSGGISLVDQIPGSKPSVPRAPVTLFDKATDMASSAVDFVLHQAQAFGPVEGALMGVVGAFGKIRGLFAAEDAVAATKGVLSEAASSSRALVPYYPSNNGFFGAVNQTVLQPGQLIDRFGGSSVSRFFSPIGTPAGARALPPDSFALPLRTFEVVKPLDVASGTVAPAFGQFGLGTQFRTANSLGELLTQGILREVKP